MPSEGVRTVISLLLLMHFTCLIVVFGGLYGASEFQLRLMEVFRPYTQTLGLDLNQGSDFSPLVILDDPLEIGIYADHQLELDLAAVEGEEPIIFPGPGFTGSLAHRRKQTLARYLAGISEAENASTWLSQKILDHYDAERGDQLRVLRHYPLDPEAAQSIELEQSDPNDPRRFEEVLEMTVAYVDENGNCKILPSQEIGRVAPVDVPTDPNSDSPAPAPNQ